MAENLPGVGAGVETGQAVQYGQPDIVPRHHNENDYQEDRQLPGDRALVSQSAEGARDKEGQHGDNHPGDNGQHNLLKFLQQLGGGPGPGPGGGQPNQNGEHQGRHDGHNGGDLQVEEQLRSLAQALGDWVNRQAGDDGVAGSHGQQGRADRGDIGQQQSQPQHPGGAAAQPGDGGRNEADDNQRDAEGDQRAQQGLSRQHDLHHHFAHVNAVYRPPGAGKTDDNTRGDADQQADREASQSPFYQINHSFPGGTAAYIMMEMHPSYMI